MVGPSGAGASMSNMINIARTAGYEIEERKRSKGIAGLSYDMFAVDELTQLAKDFETYSETMNKSISPIESHHVGKGDPMGLRQQFNRNGKKFR
jgi:hypothetical protein